MLERAEEGAKRARVWYREGLALRSESRARVVRREAEDKSQMSVPQVKQTSVGRRRRARAKMPVRGVHRDRKADHARDKAKRADAPKDS